MGHQGIDRHRMQVRRSLWWPGVVSQMAQVVQNCEVCSKKACYRMEPMLKPDLPGKLLELIYLRHSTYQSCYLEIAKLMMTTSSMVVLKLRDVFARHGIPEVVQSDNGPQFTAQEV